MNIDIKIDNSNSLSGLAFPTLTIYSDLYNVFSIRLNCKFLAITFIKFERGLKLNAEYFYII